MIRRGRGVFWAWAAALGVLACVVATVLTMRSGGGAVRSAGPARSPSAAVSAGLAASVLALGESVPPPPSLSKIYHDEHELSPRCEALLATNQRLLEESTQRLGPNPACSISLIPTSLGCVTTDSGVTWGYRLAKATAGLPKGDSPENFYHCSTKLRLELVREKRDDERVVPGGEVRLDVAQYDIVDVSLTALADYDGDGEPELLKDISRKAHEGDSVSERRVMTYHAGRMVEYGPSRGLSIGPVKDVDGDGLLDLLTSGPYGSVTTRNEIGANEWVAPPIFAYHAQRDGTFSGSTPGSRAYTEGQCPEHEVPELAAADSGLGKATELARKLICARLWGAQAAPIEARFRKVCPKSYEQYEREIGDHGSNSPADPAVDAGEEEAVDFHSCREWVLALARVKPPFTFEPARR